MSSRMASLCSARLRPSPLRCFTSKTSLATARQGLFLGRLSLNLPSGLCPCARLAENGIQKCDTIPRIEVTTMCTSVRALVLHLVLRWLFPAASLQASPVLCTPTCPLLGRGAPCSRLSLDQLLARPRRFG